MAEVKNIVNNPRIVIPGDAVSSREIRKRFGKQEDYIEVHIQDELGNNIGFIDNFKDYTLPNGGHIKSDASQLSDQIDINPVQVLNNAGFLAGKYKLILNFHRKSIWNDFRRIFVVKEVSPTRRELRVTSTYEADDLHVILNNFITRLSYSPFLKDHILYFGNNRNPIAINFKVDSFPTETELLIKLYEPLPKGLKKGSTFRIAEEVIDPISLDIDLGTELSNRKNDDLYSREIQGPNFKIDVRLNNSVPSTFKNYDTILEYQLTSSYENLLSKLESPETLDISYDYIRPISESLEAVDIPYHFENFIHFSSATERLKNFEYKLSLIEIYEDQLKDINGITGDASGSVTVLNTKADVRNKTTKLIKGFDGYERFLYYKTGSNAFAWPKRDTSGTLYSVTSSNAKTWLGSAEGASSYYGGQLLSASLFDGVNVHSLHKRIPIYIRDNPDNDQYSVFVNMIGHHFDQIWLYIKHITKTNDSHHLRGVSKELVYFTLKSLGLDTFDQFENSNLIEYILGEGQSGSAFYDYAPSQSAAGAVRHPQSLVTASIHGSVPKSDISKNIWKRLYHNAPYLLKTKGTERGLKALMSCYGIPSTILNVKEYGGSTSDKTTYKTFTYEKSGLSLRGNSGAGGYFIKTNWSSSLTDNISASAKTIELRIKPYRLSSIANHHLLSLSGSTPNNDISLVLNTYLGQDKYSTGDSSQFGKIDLYMDGAVTASTDVFPVFNGEFWNVFVGTNGTSGSSSDLKFGAYQANSFKNVFEYTASILISEQTRSLTLGDAFYNKKNGGGASEVYIGGMPANPSSAYDSIDVLSYSGSIQEVRYYFGELLSSETFKKHALEPFMYAGNTTSSAYDNLVLRLPLGSNDQRDSGSFHPNIDISYLEYSGIGYSSIGSGFTIGNYDRRAAISSMASQNWEEVIENHYLPTPDTVGKSTTSEKVRFDEGTIDDNILSPFAKAENSTQDRQPLDTTDLGVFFSPTEEINEDIIYTLGSFRLDDYIGNPLDQFSSSYSDLEGLREMYTKKIKRRFNYWDYIRTIQYIDHTLFKLVEQFVPMRANLKTGLLIEPHFLERTKFQWGGKPDIGVGQSMEKDSYQTFDFQIDPERAFTIGATGTSKISKKWISSEIGSWVVGKSKVGPGYHTDVQIVHRPLKPEGDLVTIDLDDYVKGDPEAAQAPIKPQVIQDILAIGNFTVGGTSQIEDAPANNVSINKIQNYKKRKSKTLLGNIVKGRISSTYYRSLDKGDENWW